MAAIATRRLFPNLSTKTLQISDLNGGVFVLPPFTKYETVPMEIVIVEPDLTSRRIDGFSRVDISNLSLSVAIHSGFDTAAPLAYQATWSKDEVQNVFSGELALNTALLNTYLGSSETKSAYFEIEIQEGTARQKIIILPITLQNAVTQVSAVAPTPQDEYYTKAQILAQFVPRVMGPGEQITITSQGNVKQRVLGVEDGGVSIDQIFDV